jgi:hypothetical protein
LLEDPSDFWFWLLILGFAVVGGLKLAFRWLHVARVIEDTPTSRIRSAAQGYVELTGRGEPLAHVKTIAPLTGRPCIWWRFRIERKVETRSRGRTRRSWHVINRGVSVDPFMLDDATGRCVVDPTGAEVIAGESTRWYGDEPWPTRPPGDGLLRPRDHRYRYVEERIYQHEQVYVLGDFRTHSAVAGEQVENDVAALLSDWKHDQPRLLERFDADRDGRVSLAEWEAARQEARRHVEEMRAARPPVQATHAIGRPGADQLFLIAAFPEGDLAKRFRRKAVIAFIGFAAATYALGWLVQSALG